MLMREKISKILSEAVMSFGKERAYTGETYFEVGYPSNPKFGDYSSNVALYMGRQFKLDPLELANGIVKKIGNNSIFEKIEVVKPGFINFTLKNEHIIEALDESKKAWPIKSSDKILLEYFQPNIAKPVHMGLLRTAVIGDAIKRMLLFLGYKVESDTHMGDWGTQFGFLILAHKKFGKVNEKVYAELNAEAEKDESVREAAKQEFVKLEQSDKENRKIWQSIVDTSVKEFLKINDLMDILPFEHHWPESFYVNKMPAVLEKLKAKGLLKESQGAQVVNLEEQGLGIAVIVKSDTGTTYLLRDLATFIYRKEKEKFTKQLYVVDNRQLHSFKQLFAILKLMGEMEDNEAVHIDYGFISFKGVAMSTRKGNMVLAEDVIKQAEEKVAKIIAEKNPDLKDKAKVVKAISKSALKYFDLKHNRHSDIEFDWDEVLDFEGDSGPYLQYAYARLASILRKSNASGPDLSGWGELKITSTEREILFKSSILTEIVQDSLKDYLPNILVNYLFNFATLLNKFYHESPVTQEKDKEIRDFRLALIAHAKTTLKTGLDLLGIEALEEM